MAWAPPLYTLNHATPHASDGMTARGCPISTQPPERQCTPSNHSSTHQQLQSRMRGQDLMICLSSTLAHLLPHFRPSGQTPHRSRTATPPRSHSKALIDSCASSSERTSQLLRSVTDSGRSDPAERKLKTSQIVLSKSNCQCAKVTITRGWAGVLVFSLPCSVALGMGHQPWDPYHEVTLWLKGRGQRS